MVGATAPALSDLFTVPFPGKMPGAQVHAAVVDDILSSRPIRAGVVDVRQPPSRSRRG